MTFRKKTLRTMSPTARKVARLAGEAGSLATRLKNLVPNLQQLDADSRALATAKQSNPVWLDIQALTEALTEELDDSGLEATPDNLSALWNNFMATELHGGLQSCLKYSPAFRDKTSGITQVEG